MRILLYSLCLLSLLNCGQKGDLVRPKSAAEKLADAIATPTTSQATTMIDAIATPITSIVEEDELEEQEFEVIDFDDAETIILDEQSLIIQDKYLVLASTPDQPCPNKDCRSE
ncbi:hypothetical protein [Candidatus Albibeggiatoa sp. nov. BB20]|uniref:hypothetical protein n=1 Tax=Candidatus Albibeggiatoa sp. nov. BB20 TaxID=3162723 RepID=UPI0033657F74